jgi:hypothetical protein
MFVDCNKCAARVVAEIIAKEERFDADSFENLRLSLVKCNSCENIMFMKEEVLDVVADPDGEPRELWSAPARMWPSPDRSLSLQIPDIVRVSLVEAEKCFKGQTFTACAVMCGRALEGICHDNGVQKRLAEGLKELSEKQIIDGRLFEWGNALREQRNLAAHPS